jgi:hypothetical protein
MAEGKDMAGKIIGSGVSARRGLGPGVEEARQALQVQRMGMAMAILDPQAAGIRFLYLSL